MKIAIKNILYITTFYGVVFGAAPIPPTDQEITAARAYLRDHQTDWGLCHSCFTYDEELGNINKEALRIVVADKRYKQGLLAYASNASLQKTFHGLGITLAGVGTTLAAVSAGASDTQLKTNLSIAAAATGGLGTLLISMSTFMATDVLPDLPRALQQERIH